MSVRTFIYVIPSLCSNFSLVEVIAGATNTALKMLLLTFLQSRQGPRILTESKEDF